MSRLFHRRPHDEGSARIVPGESERGALAAHRDVGVRTERDWRGYDDVAETYERVQAPRTAEVAADLVELAQPLRGGRVLDVGAGTGSSTEAAQRAVGPDGIAVGIDSSLGMLGVGARARQGLRLAAGEAIDLPFRDAAFDVVVANFVLSHFTRYDTALFDMLRVLKPGGRLAVSAWSEREDEFQRTWRDLVEDVTTHDLLRDALDRAMPWEERFRDPARLEETLRGSGLHPVTVQRREYRFRLSRDDYVAGRETTASGRFLRDMLGDQEFRSFGERARRVFAERFPEVLTDFRDVLLAVGSKPA
jgi:ubiquinone/menaquinone biosynthesis C-methylase UbiE